MGRQEVRAAFWLPRGPRALCSFSLRTTQHTRPLSLREGHSARDSRRALTWAAGWGR